MRFVAICKKIKKAQFKIANMVISMLKALRSVFQQMPVLLYTGNKLLGAIHSDRTVLVDFYIPLCFCKKTRFPFRLRVWRRNQMNCLEYASGLPSVGILLFGGRVGNDFFRILSVNPGL